MSLDWKQFKKKEVRWGLFVSFVVILIFVTLSPDGGEHSFSGYLAEFIWGEENENLGFLIIAIASWTAFLLTKEFVFRNKDSSKQEKKAIRFGFLAAIVVLVFLLIISPDSGDHNIIEVLVEKFLEGGNLFVEVLISIAGAVGAYVLTRKFVMRKK